MFLCHNFEWWPLDAMFRLVSISSCLVVQAKQNHRQHDELESAVFFANEITNYESGVFTELMQTYQEFALQDGKRRQLILDKALFESVYRVSGLVLDGSDVK